MAGDPDLGWSLGVLFRTWQAGVTRALDGLPHGARGFQIMLTVTHDGPPTQAALAAHLGIDRTVLTYVLDDLVAAGLLERQVDATDRRVRRLMPTRTGRTRLARLERRVAAAEDDLLAGLSADERRALRTSLHHAASRIHGSEPGHDACSAVAELLDEPSAKADARPPAAAG